MSLDLGPLYDYTVHPTYYSGNRNQKVMFAISDMDIQFTTYPRSVQATFLDVFGLARGQ